MIERGASDLSDAHVLLVEDTPGLARTYLGYMRDEAYAVTHVETGAAAKAALEAGGFDLVLLDLRLPDISGQEVLAWMRANGIALPVIVITAQGSVTAAVETMQAGAVDFLIKPFAEERLLISIRTQLDKSRFLRDAAPVAPSPGGPVPAAAPQAESETEDGFAGFIGTSVPMRAVYRLIRSAATSDATVFITGESGTGKEVCAEAIHAQGSRAKQNLVPINCSAIPGELMESEIFGHVKGAFTGATADKPGAARAADGGTLFLDEICEMSMELQAKLLRFIQTGTFSPVGQAMPVKVDVRFICATNRDPMAEVIGGRFREDLYYRLHVIPIALPPLRARGDDVLLLADRLLDEYAALEGKGFAGLSDDARRAIVAYPWPGNVRQLQNVLRNGVVLNDGEALTAAMLRSPVGTAPGEGAAPAPAPASPAAPVRAERPDPGDLNALAQAIEPLDLVERRAIESAVALCGGDVRKAAVFLDVSPATIYRKQKAWREAAS